MQAVVNSSNATDDIPFGFGQEEVSRRMAIEGMSFPIKAGTNLRLERRTKVRIVSIKLIGEFNEFSDITPIAGIDFVNAHEKILTIIIPVVTSIACL
jgi:hypothetical protein